jgi:hypothetical protein
MSKFSITDCVIYWDTRENITTQAKEVIIRDLKESSTTIERALLFLKDAALDNKFPEVRFPIGDNWEYKMFLHIFDGPDPLYYRLCIQKSTTDKSVAELICEKNNICSYILKESTADLFEKEIIQ